MVKFFREAKKGEPIVKIELCPDCKTKLCDKHSGKTRIPKPLDSPSLPEASAQCSE